MANCRRRSLDLTELSYRREPIFTISLLASVQSITRVFAPYAWGALSDHTGQRVKLLRFSAAVALASSFGLWWHGGAWWLALVVMEHALRNRAQCGDAQQQQKAQDETTEAASPQASFL